MSSHLAQTQDVENNRESNSRMPQKHAKNNCASKCFNHWERNEASSVGHYGTTKVRLGGDSQQTFGHCCLCIHPAVEPMATPSGHVYCKECIVEFLLAKTQELKLQRAAFEAQAKSQANDEVTADATRKVEATNEFMSTQQQLVLANPQQSSSSATGSNKVEGNGKKRGREEQGREGSETGISTTVSGVKQGDDVVEKELKRIAVLKTKKERQEELRTTSWWLPQFQPEAGKEVVKEPPKRPGSPMSGEPLRPKDLIPVIFTIDSEKEKTAHISGGDVNRGSIICPVTRKGIISQKAVLIKRTGHVMLEDAAKQFALPTMTCPVTGEKFKNKDLIPLVNGGTSFTASGQVEVTKYAPGLR